jgi:hypothetical protein
MNLQFRSGPTLPGRGVKAGPGNPDYDNQITMILDRQSEFLPKS